MVRTSQEHPRKHLVWEETRWEQTDARETKPAYRTTELYVFVIMTCAVLAVARVGILDAEWGWGLATALSIGYLLSRGLAKSGTPLNHDHHTRVARTQPPLAMSRDAVHDAVNQQDARPAEDGAVPSRQQQRR